MPRTHKEGQDKNRRGQRSLEDVHEQKRKAASKDPGADRSRENLEKFKRGEK